MYKIPAGNKTKTTAKPFYQRWRTLQNNCKQDFCIKCHVCCCDVWGHTWAQI